MKIPNYLKLIISLIIPMLLGSIAGLFTAQAVPEWYETLQQPSFNPPNWIFGPVWTTLYILMGISCYMIWRRTPSPERNLALLIYAVQLALNFAWSFLFFYFHLIDIALLEIVLLWLAIGVMLKHFYRLQPLAAYLNIPYFLWVSFATALNAAYFFLN